MRRELVIAAGPGEWRAIALEDGAAVELHVERDDSRPAGSVHLGRVLRRVAGLDAALVDIGDERPGFLPLRPDPNGAPRLDEGAAVLVQVRREAQGGKGALLVIPAAPPDDGEALRLADPPAQLEPAPGFAAALALRLSGAATRVWVDDPAAVQELRAAFPQAEIARCETTDWPVDVDAAFDAALQATIALPGGGSLHVEEARAAVLIDVDTGTPEKGSAARSAQDANNEAVAAIARALRLRQLGGGIIVDFAALGGRRERERLREQMAAALAGDPAQPRVLGWTRLGHLEIVRPRHGRPLSAAMLDPQTRQKSAATLAFEALRAVYREARARPAAAWRLTVSPAVLAALRGPAAAALRALEERLGRTIELSVATDGAAAPFDISAL